MIRFAAFAAAALMATAAGAQPADQTASVSLKIAGKSDTAVRSAIRRAAYEVCAEVHGSPTSASDILELMTCQRKTEAKALETFHRAAAAGADVTEAAALSQPVKVK